MVCLDLPMWLGLSFKGLYYIFVFRLGRGLSLFHCFLSFLQLGVEKVKRWVKSWCCGRSLGPNIVSVTSAHPSHKGYMGSCFCHSCHTKPGSFKSFVRVSYCNISTPIAGIVFKSLLKFTLRLWLQRLPLEPEALSLPFLWTHVFLLVWYV